MSDNKGKFAYGRQVLIGAGSGFMALVIIIGGFTLSGGVKNQATGTTTPTQSSAPSASPTNSAGLARDCSVASLLADPKLGNFYGSVINAQTGELMLDVNGNQAKPTASVMKLITAVAALQVLGPNYTVTTNVYADPSTPGTIVLVGAGDPTLSRLGPGLQSVYDNGPKLSDLAVQVTSFMRATPISNIILDSTYFADSGWLPDVKRTEMTGGYQSVVTALQADGDRNNPQAETSPRSADPVGHVGTWFKRALGDIGSAATITKGALPAGVSSANIIATVHSQPISKWISHMLLVSDNTEAEYLARLVSKKEGFDGSFSSLDAALKKALTNAGIDSTGVVIHDGSGESMTNAASPQFINSLLKFVYSSQGTFKQIMQDLPVAGESGSLQSRFTGANKDAVGHIFAKTGWTDIEYSLAGLIKSKDGTDLLFTFYALGKVKADAKTSLDNLASAVYRCGDRLSSETTVASPSPSPTN